MARKWSGVAGVVRKEDFDPWLRRVLESPELATKLASYVEGSRFTAAEAEQAEDLAVARVCFALDPLGPIRYRGLAVMPDGFGAALAVAMIERGDASVFAEAIRRDVPRYWFEAAKDIDPEQGALEKVFSQFKKYIQSTEFGQGLERCLYDLNHTLPCHSPLIESEYVTDPKRLLGALDRVSKRSDSRQLPVDRHIAAFVNARISGPPQDGVGASARSTPRALLLERVLDGLL